MKKKTTTGQRRPPCTLRAKKSGQNNKNKNDKNNNFQNGLGSADGVRLNPFTAASLNLNFNLKQQHDQGSGDNPFNQLRMDTVGTRLFIFIFINEAGCPMVVSCCLTKRHT
mmetsp:Transcript_26166/g.44654  ORF Transcript_26166/g.44654 Transcript_26166/m.44654 type:complete len:111 (+) Transcript_26166:144-476(+)